MTIPFSRSLILWISVQSRKLRLRQTPDIFGRLRTSSEDFELLRKTSDFFGNLRKWSCRLQKFQHSQDKNLTLISQKKLAGIFYGENTPIPTQSLRRIFKLILQEFAFGFNGKNYLQTHGTAMGTKMAVAFANIFMSVVETEILNFSKTKPLEWERYIDDIFSLWRTERKEMNEFIALANRHHPSIKFTAEMSDKEINFLDTTVYKGERFHNQGILDITLRAEALRSS